MTPEEALALAQNLAAQGRVRFADATQANLYDSEIQEIFFFMYVRLHQRKPKRSLWASDQSTLGHVLSQDETGAYTEQAIEALRAVEQEFHLNALTPNTLWVEAAAALRHQRHATPRV